MHQGLFSSTVGSRIGFMDFPLPPILVLVWCRRPQTRLARLAGPADMDNSNTAKVELHIRCTQKRCLVRQACSLHRRCRHRSFETSFCHHVVHHVSIRPRPSNAVACCHPQPPSSGLQAVPSPRTAVEMARRRIQLSPSFPSHRARLPVSASHARSIAHDLCFLVLCPVKCGEGMLVHLLPRFATISLPYHWDHGPPGALPVGTWSAVGAWNK